MKFLNAPSVQSWKCLQLIAFARFTIRWHLPPNILFSTRVLVLVSDFISATILSRHNLCIIWTSIEMSTSLILLQYIPCTCCDPIVWHWGKNDLSKLDWVDTCQLHINPLQVAHRMSVCLSCPVCCNVRYCDCDSDCEWKCLLSHTCERMQRSDTCNTVATTLRRRHGKVSAHPLA